MNRPIINLLVLSILAVFPAFAQPNPPAAAIATNVLAAASQTNQILSLVQHADQVRAACIQGRRSICGKIIQILPDGLVIESGYTNLLRAPLTTSWLVPSTATASRPENQLESNEPGALCIGLVFLTDYPKSKRLVPKRYDYVIIEGYPAGQHTYASVGSVQKTVRHFSAQLAKAVDLDVQSETHPPAASAK
jgi:hypothetical protein